MAGNGWGRGRGRSRTQVLSNVRRRSGGGSLKFPLETLVLDQNTNLVGRSWERSGTGNGSQAGIGPRPRPYFFFLLLIIVFFFFLAAACLSAPVARCLNVCRVARPGGAVGLCLGAVRAYVSQPGKPLAVSLSFSSPDIEPAAR